MKYSRDEKPFILTDKSFMALYDEGIDYFTEEVLPLYTDVVINDPAEGIQYAWSDFLGNDSPIQDEDGEYISWEEAIQLGKELYDLSHLTESTKRRGPAMLRQNREDKFLTFSSLQELKDWCDANALEMVSYGDYGSWDLASDLRADAQASWFDPECSSPPTVTILVRGKDNDCK